MSSIVQYSERIKSYAMPWSLILMRGLSHGEKQKNMFLRCSYSKHPITFPAPASTHMETKPSNKKYFFRKIKIYFFFYHFFFHCIGVWKATSENTLIKVKVFLTADLSFQKYSVNYTEESLWMFRSVFTCRLNLLLSHLSWETGMVWQHSSD